MTLPSSQSNDEALATHQVFRQMPLACRGHTRPVVFLSFSDVTSDGYFSISACKDGKPILRKGDTGDWVGTFIGHKGAVWCSVLNPDATIAATASADFTAKIWDATTGDEVFNLPHTHIVRSIDILRDSSRLLTASKNTVYLYDIRAPTKPVLDIVGHDAVVKRCSFAAIDTGSFVLSVSDDCTLRLWETRTGGEIARNVLPCAPSGMHLSRDGATLTVTCGQKILFFKVPSMTSVKAFDVGFPVYSASLSPDGASLVFGGEDFKVYRWDFESGREISSYRGHFGPVHCVRFSPDGELYASGSEDGTVRLWQTRLGTTYGLWKVATPDE